MRGDRGLKVTSRENVQTSAGYLLKESGTFIMKKQQMGGVKTKCAPSEWDSMD
nr:hypothetical protein [Bacteroides intestinalis]